MVKGIIEKIASELFSAKDREFLALAFSPETGQAELDSFLEPLNPDRMGAAQVLMISYLRAQRGDLEFPTSLTSRFKALLHDYKVRDIILMAEFLKLCTALKEAGIEFLPIKGGAMMCLRPELYRQMSDIDILVRPGDFKRARTLIESLGYDCSTVAHSFDVHRKEDLDGLMDIHRYFPVTSGRGAALTGPFFSRASQALVFSVEGMLPCREDLLFITLSNLTRNIMENASHSGIIFNLFDIKYLLNRSGGFDWDVFFSDVRISRSEGDIAFAAALVRNIAPGLLPASLEGLGEHERAASYVHWRRYVFRPLQERSKELPLGAAFRHPSRLPETLRVRGKYCWEKWVCKKFRRRRSSI